MDSPEADAIRANLQLHAEMAAYRRMIGDLQVCIDAMLAAPWDKDVHAQAVLLRLKSPSDYMTAKEGQ